MKIYLVIISILAVALTAIDKFRAIRGKSRNRIPESTLITLAALGGSVAMLITMIIIRHKTKKPKFILGIPIIITLQAFVLYFAFKQGVII